MKHFASPVSELPAARHRDSLAPLMRRFGHLWRSAVTASLEEIGLTLLQWAVLELVEEQPGRSQTELSKTASLEGPSLVRILDGLEALGWLQRKPDTYDRRVKRVYLTGSGGLRMIAAHKAIDSVHLRATSKMSEADIKEMHRLMRLFIDGLG